MFFFHTAPEKCPNLALEKKKISKGCMCEDFPLDYVFLELAWMDLCWCKTYNKYS